MQYDRWIVAEVVCKSAFLRENPEQNKSFWKGVYLGVKKTHIIAKCANNIVLWDFIWYTVHNLNCPNCSVKIFFWRFGRSYLRWSTRNANLKSIWTPLDNMKNQIEFVFCRLIYLRCGCAASNFYELTII